MNAHTLKLALRNFRRHKSSFFINLFGLSTGLACTLLIVLWVNDELQVDKFHTESDRLYNVMEHQQYAESIMTTHSTPGMLAETLKEEVPEIELAATITWNNSYTLSVGETNVQASGYHAGSDFFKMFSFELIQGQAEDVLRDLNAIVLSESTAASLFGSVSEAVGQSLEIDHGEVYQVSGVFANTPSNSSYEFDLILNYEKFKNEANNSWLRTWGSNGPTTKIMLTAGADAEKVTAKIADFIKARNDQSNVTLFLQSFSDNYLYGRFESGKLVGGRIDYVRLFSIIAAFILLIACINFMNLSTARASLRAREVGVKKAVGAGRGSLVRQYLTESIMIAFAAFLIAILLVVVVLPQFNLITDKEIALQLSPAMLLGFIGIILLTGLLAGSYPALYLSSFKPVAVLKGEIKTSLGELWARRGLVVFQFTLSVILIVAVSVVYQQIHYVQSKNLGYDKDNLIYFSMNGKLEEQAETFLAEAGKLPGVAGISTIGHDLIGRQNNTSGLDWPGKDPEARILFENVRVNYDLLETIGVALKEGRSFSREFGADTSKIIFNEAAVKVMNLENPIGQKIRLWGNFDREIIGVVKDFHFQSLHEQVNPLFFVLDAENTWMVMARLEGERTQEAISNLQSFYEDFNPGFAFDFEFSDEQYAMQYAAEQRVASLSKYFAGFAILISCLGLFGLAAFTADRKKKEIGIRKVLGASVSNIVTLLTKDFTRLVIAAILIGLPIAYYITWQWLNQFAFRINLTFWYFLIAGLLVLLISWLTVGSQAFRSAHIDPKECLRDI